MPSRLTAVALGLALSAAPAGAALIAGYNSDRHDRDGADFLLDGYDLTGVGVGSRGGILISDRHVLAATHFRGTTYSFQAADGTIVSRNVSTNRTLQTLLPADDPDAPGSLADSDLTLVTLASPIDALTGVTPLSIASVGDPASASAELDGAEVFIYDQNNRVGRNLIDGGSLIVDPNDDPDQGPFRVTAGPVELSRERLTDNPGPSNPGRGTYAIVYDYDLDTNGGVDGLGIDEIGLVGGDSGHAGLLVINGQVVAVGPHHAILDGDAMLPVDTDQPYLSLTTLAGLEMYRSQISSFVAADGGLGLSYVAVPEPASLLALAGVGGLTLLRRRR